MNTRLYPALFFAVLFAACVKDKPEPAGPPVSPGAGKRVLIVNEGSLGNGNGSLSVFNMDKDSMYNDVFFQKNGQLIGDVLQSAAIIGDELYLAVNNSDKLVFVDKEDYSLKGNIVVNKPRYMAMAAADKMYVTSLFYPEINIIDTKTKNVTGKITVDFPNTEGLAVLNSKVYACNWDTACNYIYEIDPASDEITHRINITGRAPQQVMVDKNQKLWVLAGNVYRGKKASLTQIDPVTRTIIKSFEFPEGADVMKPAWNPAKDTLYYLGVNYKGGTDYNGVYCIATGALSLPEAPLIQAQRFQYFWALGVDSATNTIYVGDPKGFIQKGAVNLYDAAGTRLKTLETGIGPGFFLFQ